MVPEQGGEVSLTLQAAPDLLTIRVADNGPGLEPHELEAVFQPFRRLGPAHVRPPGTGLGLPISRRIVEGHGGTLRAEPAPRGACFVIRLPVAQAGGAR